MDLILVLFLVGLLASLFGFGWLSAALLVAAKVLLFVILVLVIISLVCNVTN